jgi:hypothetical protein
MVGKPLATFSQYGTTSAARRIGSFHFLPGNDKYTKLSQKSCKSCLPSEMRSLFHQGLIQRLN